MWAQRGFRRCALLTVVLLMVPLGAPESRAEAATGSFETYTWNLAGQTMHRGSTGVADVAGRKIKVHRPLVAAFQEVCVAQYRRLQAALGPTGYSSAFYISLQVTRSDDRSCYLRGNAVFVRGANIGGFTYRFAAQRAGKAEKRGMVCTRVALLQGSYVGCSLHLVNGAASVAETQQAEAYRVLRDRYVGYPRILGGDFNRPWPDPGLHRTWHVTYNEADEGGYPPKYNEPTSAEGKIDYLFAVAGTYDRVSGNAVDAGSWSDHDHYYGTFRTR